MLQRSPKALLQIRLREVEREGDLKRILENVISESHRWKRLSFSFRNINSLKRIAAALTSSLPHLESLELTPLYCILHVPSSTWSPGSLAAGACSLTSLKIIGIPLLDCHPTVFNRLTTLEFQPFDPPDRILSYDALAQVLSSASCLRSLSFFSNVKESSEPYPSTILLPELRQLQVGFGEPIPGCIGNMYTIFHVPKLEKLSIELLDGVSGPQHEFSVDYIKSNGRSRYPNLRIFSVQSDVECEQFIDESFFRALPLIEDATLFKFSADAILKMLSEGSGGPSSVSLWPCLTRLEVLRFDMVLLCDLVRSRIDAGRPLESITAYQPESSPFSDDDILWLGERIKLNVICIS